MWPHGMVFRCMKSQSLLLLKKKKIRKCYNIDNIPSYTPTEMNFNILFPLWKDLHNTYLIPHLCVYLSGITKCFTGITSRLFVKIFKHSKIAFHTKCSDNGK